MSVRSIASTLPRTSSTYSPTRRTWQKPLANARRAPTLQIIFVPIGTMALYDEAVEAFLTHNSN